MAFPLSLSPEPAALRETVAARQTINSITAVFFTFYPLSGFLVDA